jgi:anti-sigma factor RsiW
MWRPVSEVELQLYVDGRLARTRAVAVEAYLEANPSEALRIGAYCRQNELLQALGRAIDRDLPPEGETRLKAQVARYFTRRRLRMKYGGAALALLIAAGVGAAGEALWSSSSGPESLPMAQAPPPHPPAHLIDDRVR